MEDSYICRNINTFQNELKNNTYYNRVDKYFFYYLKHRVANLLSPGLGHWQLHSTESRLPQLVGQKIILSFCVIWCKIPSLSLMLFVLILYLVLIVLVKQGLERVKVKHIQTLHLPCKGSFGSRLIGIRYMFGMS